MKLKVYGCRGSTVFSRSGSRYGCNTSCITIESGGEFLIIDAGSGLTLLNEHLRSANPHLMKAYGTPVNVLLSHLHLDHIVGFGTFIPAWKNDTGIRVFTCSRNDSPLDEQIFGVFSPPYWPVTMKDTANVDCVPIKAGEKITIGKFTVTPFAAEHSDNTISFHITDGVKSVVHLLDNEISQMNAEKSKVLMEFCKNADIVVFDAAYSQNDYKNHVGWGHSTVAHGVEFSKKAKCKCMLFSHFAPKYSDEELDSWQEHFCGDEIKYILAREGLEIEV